MLNAAEQLAKYKEEKDYVCQGDALDEANFPSFKQWRVEYVREYQEVHQTVDVALADRMMEAVQAEADTELEVAFETALEADLEDQEEYDDMTDETTPTEITTEADAIAATQEIAGILETTETETPVAAATAPETTDEEPAKPKAKKPRKRNAPKKTAKKATTKKTAKKANTKTAPKAASKPKAEKKVTKNDLALKIFGKHFGKKSRADIIKLFISDAGLTANGAATYYQKMKAAAEKAS